MASFVSTSGVGLVSYSRLPCMDGLKQRSISHKPTTNFKSRSSRRLVVVRAEGQAINPEIRKSEEKVVDSVVVTELSKPLTPYCRCWRSGTFPLCDGSHVKHNKATGDNVGPLLLKKQ
ncbi:CDGSH iron-sulfur domain-containing protein 2A [Morus notabilis]|uniref:CDGSH iron-sulfur domain-containing protein 2A n=1 Tax=Morus notabilis TaxID=981085 RepID=W9S1F7_9ROSA|nr:CDGSH iron-sulfur domain-containing protein NEET isoform X2 [Morus notabilis]EXC20884.1 CDGSH iron-sulfur domain-containing protein 2A [Morus notabilis]